MKTIHLLEAWWSGHHPTYFKFLTKVMLELGQEVIAFCSKPQVSRGFCMGERVHKFKLGITVNEGDVFQYIEVLHQLL